MFTQIFQFRENLKRAATLLEMMTKNLFGTIIKWLKVINKKNFRRNSSKTET